MKLEQVQQMITTLGIDQAQIMKYIQENFGESLQACRLPSKTATCAMFDGQCVT